VRLGVEVTCAVAAVSGPGRTDVVDGVQVRRARSFGVFLSQPVAPGFPAIVRRTAADILHLHHPNPLGDLAALADARRPLVVTQHSDVVRQRLLWPLYGPLVRRVFAGARFVAIGSEQLLRTSRELQGFEKKARVIPFGIDPTRLDATPAVVERAAALRSTWGGGPVVLTVGRMVGYKGFDVLLRAARGLRATVVLVGTGPLEAGLRASAPPNVRFTGRISEEELVACYHAADVFCLPSVTIAEAFGIVLLEAMACGLPLVTTALPTGVSAVNRDGVTGLIVPPRDAGALRDALATSVADDQRRAEMGAAARRVLQTEYTAALMAERYLSLYREALG